jgi:hypothetical protein
MIVRERERHISATIVVAVVVGVAGLVGGATSCGTSIRALYESDVRFEHCMALDATPDVKPTLPRTCWEEWIRFYQFGQTRDRVAYARQRTALLGSASNFEESVPPALRGVAPDPTSASAPPPSMLPTADAGVADAAAAQDDDPRAQYARCAATCDAARDTCTATCRRTPPCEQACGLRAKRCEARCGRPDAGAAVTP